MRIDDPWSAIPVLLLVVIANCLLALMAAGPAEKKRRERKIEQLRARLNE